MGIPQNSPYYVDQQGDLLFDYHPGQQRVMDAPERFILALAGTQGGKTAIGAWWLLREMALRGPGDYMVAGPTFALMQKKVLPEFTKLFESMLGLGFYRSLTRSFHLNRKGCLFLWPGRNIDPVMDPTTVFFGHAQDPDSLESATAKAAWLDEAGQKKFRVGSWEAIQRRLSIHEGRTLITTTPYTLGWLKSELHDLAAEDPDIALIQFDSTENPSFPQAEYHRMKTKLPGWKFNMMYRGRFERPAGMIYENFSRRIHLLPRFPIPTHWGRYQGLDFGGVNTASIFLAREPGTLRFYLYRTYHEGGRTVAAHVADMLKEEPSIPTACGGSGSEQNWRDEYTAAGLPVQAPDVTSVEVGINHVYSMLQATVDGRTDLPHLVIFEDLKDIIDDLESYSRELDEYGEPTEAIEDKETWHRLDGLRYIATLLVDDPDLVPVLV